MSRRARRVRLGRDRVRVRRSHLAEIQLTSTSDIAFLLLIFFLATAVFVSQVGLPLVLPPAGARPLPVEPTDLVVLEVDGAGRVYTEGTEIPLEALADWASDPQRRTPGRIYLLEVAARCPYASLVAVLDALRAAAVERISFRVVGAS